MEIEICLPKPHPKQSLFLSSDKKRIVVKAGRRSGKTVMLAIMAVKKFLQGYRVLYAAPTIDQVDKFWSEVSKALQNGFEKKILYKNESKHLICYQNNKALIKNKDLDLSELGEARIRAKTAWNADTLRGDYADYLLLDEWQLMNEDAWGVVGAPMLLDNNGDVVFCFTPPSLHTRSISKANNPRHAIELYKKALLYPERWQTIHFTSHDNPYLSREALSDIVKDMTRTAVMQEIYAEDVDEVPGALWKREDIEVMRTIRPELKELDYIVVGVDPSITSEGDECGIVVVARCKDKYYVLDDLSLQGSPNKWASRVVEAYYGYKANKIVAESNQGGEMVSAVINEIDKFVPIELVYASRGKHTRAEPIAAIYEQRRVYHAGNFFQLEEEMCTWVPGDKSPNRMDALVWGMTYLISQGVKPLVQDTKIDVSNLIKNNFKKDHSEILETIKRQRDATKIKNHRAFV